MKVFETIARSTGFPFSITHPYHIVVVVAENLEDARQQLAGQGYAQLIPLKELPLNKTGVYKLS